MPVVLHAAPVLLSTHSKAQCSSGLHAGSWVVGLTSHRSTHPSLQRLFGDGHCPRHPLAMSQIWVSAQAGSAIHAVRSALHCSRTFPVQRYTPAVHNGSGQVSLDDWTDCAHSPAVAQVCTSVHPTKLPGQVCRTAPLQRSAPTLSHPFA